MTERPIFLDEEATGPLPTVRYDLSLSEAPYEVEFNPYAFSELLQEMDVDDKKIADLKILMTDAEHIPFRGSYASYDRSKNEITLSCERLWGVHQNLKSGTDRIRNEKTEVNPSIAEISSMASRKALLHESKHILQGRGIHIASFATRVGVIFSPAFILSTIGAYIANDRTDSLFVQEMTRIITFGVILPVTFALEIPRDYKISPEEIQAHRFENKTDYDDQLEQIITVVARER